MNARNSSETLLTQQIAEAERLREFTDLATVQRWHERTRSILTNFFAEDAPVLQEFIAIVSRFEDLFVLGTHGDLAKRTRLVDQLSALLQSSIEQLKLERESESTPATAPDLHPYEAARRALKLFHTAYLEHGDRNWSLSVEKGGADDFAAAGLSVDQATRALRLLRSKQLLEPMGLGGRYKISTLGVRASDHLAVLDEELPLEAQEAFPHNQRSSSVAKPDLGGVEDLVDSDSIRTIVLRDIAELGQAVQQGLHKCTLLLGGSILEGILIDVLDRNRAIAGTYMGKKKFPEDASLKDLIRIAGDPNLLESPRHLLSSTSIGVARTITEHRDLIHPYAEERGRITVDTHTAGAIVKLLELVLRDLTAAKERGDISAYERK